MTKSTLFVLTFYAFVDCNNNITIHKGHFVPIIGLGQVHVHAAWHQSILLECMICLQIFFFYQNNDSQPFFLLNEFRLFLAYLEKL